MIVSAAINILIALLEFCAELAIGVLEAFSEVFFVAATPGAML